jgi:hypothetical protein
MNNAWLAFVSRGTTFQCPLFVVSEKRRMNCNECIELRSWRHRFVANWSAVWAKSETTCTIVKVWLCCTLSAPRWVLTDILWLHDWSVRLAKYHIVAYWHALPLKQRQNLHVFDISCLHWWATRRAKFVAFGTKRWDLWWSVWVHYSTYWVVANLRDLMCWSRESYCIWRRSDWYVCTKVSEKFAFTIIRGVTFRLKLLSPSSG